MKIAAYKQANRKVQENKSRGVKVGLSSLLAEMEALRKEFEAAETAEMEKKINEGTATITDQINFYKTRQARYSPSSSVYKELETEISKLQRDYRFDEKQVQWKTKEITDTEYLKFLQDERMTVKDDTQEALNLDLQIYALQQTTDSNDLDEQYLAEFEAYQTEQKTQQQHLDWLKSYLNAIPESDTERRNQIREEIAKTQDNINDLNNDAALSEMHNKWTNKLISDQEFIDWLSTTGLSTADSPTDKAAINNLIRNAQNVKVGSQADLDYTKLVVQKNSHQITSDQYISGLQALASRPGLNEEDKLGYQNKIAGAIEDRIQEEITNAVQNYEYGFIDESQALGNLNALKVKYPEYADLFVDSEYQLKERMAMNKYNQWQNVQDEKFNNLADQFNLYNLKLEDQKNNGEITIQQYMDKYQQLSQWYNSLVTQKENTDYDSTGGFQTWALGAGQPVDPFSNLENTFNTLTGQQTETTGAVGGGKNFYRIGIDIYDVSTNKKISYTDWKNNWTGRATEVSAPTATTMPTTTTPSTPTMPTSQVGTDQIPFKAGLTEQQKASITNLLSKPIGQWTQTDKNNWNYATNNASPTSYLTQTATVKPPVNQQPTTTQYTTVQKGGTTMRIDKSNLQTWLNSGWTEAGTGTQQAAAIPTQPVQGGQTYQVPEGQGGSDISVAGNKVTIANQPLGKVGAQTTEYYIPEENQMFISSDTGIEKPVYAYKGGQMFNVVPEGFTYEGGHLRYTGPEGHDPTKNYYQDYVEALKKQYGIDIGQLKQYNISDLYQYQTMGLKQKQTYGGSIKKTDELKY